MNLHIIRTSALLLIFSLFLQGCKEDSSSDYPHKPAPKSILALAGEQEDLSLFVEAAEAAQIEFAMQPGAPYTLMAPTDSSFKAYLNSQGYTTIQDLHNAMGDEKFRLFVSYHILEKKVKAENISNGYVVTFAKTTEKDRLHSYMTRNELNITINRGAARVIQANITSDAGVIHKIDGVLTPLTLEGLTKVNPNFSKLSIAIDFAGSNIQQILNDETQYYTLFAPTDAAFNMFLNHYGYVDINALLDLIGPQQIEDALKYHLIKGRFKAEDFQNQDYETLLAGASLKILKDNSGTILITDDSNNPLVKITNTNIVAVNGVMHIIDQVLEY